ncbi:hypothetical protein CQA57_07530 [Helicobacter anseris]|uniref:Zinc ribbon domain-containing protein n=1 Tax=Helicobacter anseris TaxID=375926 RepID=A0A3D8J3T8_9HELI|nr:hypothetical protein [Helicobacter anseris]RDU71896.1 hypothetical protein CQA57_07530 [Helicobacter anseris]
MIECLECKNEISDTAYDCPKCGKVLRKPSRGFFGKIILFVFWIFLLAMPVLFGIVYYSASTQENIASGLLVGIGMYL